jgi:hypothetical protein
MKLVDYFIGLLINLVAGVILFYWLPILNDNPNRSIIIIGIILVTSLFTIWAILLWRLLAFRKVGIVDIVSSMTSGKGCTERILKTVKDDFSFMGIAARKWINTGPTLENVIKKVASRKKVVRFLLLDPNSAEARRLSQTQHGNPNEVPELINDSIKKLQLIRKKGFNIKLRLYSFLPIFRIALVDNNTAYIGFYRSATLGEDSPQIIMDKHTTVTYFQPFFEYFEDVWLNQSVDPKV